MPISTTATSPIAFLVATTSPPRRRRWTTHEINKLLSKRMLVVLHGVAVDRVVAEYPDLGNKLMLVSTLGAENLARLITNAIRKPPRILPG
jgi:hypothetical protein